MAIIIFYAALVFTLLLHVNPAFGQTPRFEKKDHIIEVKSNATTLLGQKVKLYLREVKSTPKVRGISNAVLFIHGSGWPAEVVFDTHLEDYSWMKYLAKEGFATYALDLTGYGRSSRPIEMNNPCHLAESQQQQIIPSVIPKLCASTYAQALTSPESDLLDIDAAVNFIRRTMHINSVAIVGWSLGGPRALRYSLAHPQKINRLILLAPSYSRDLPLLKPAEPIVFGRLMNGLNHADFIAEWDAQLKCEGQVKDSVRNIVWSEMLAADSVGATWGEGISRSPAQAWNWGFNRSSAATLMVPTLLVSGEFDESVSPVRVSDLYNDLGAKKKVFINLVCSSHNAIWEKNHLLLFKASLEWLKNTKVDDISEGNIKLGADG